MIHLQVSIITSARLFYIVINILERIFVLFINILECFGIKAASILYFYKPCEYISLFLQKHEEKGVRREAKLLCC